MKKFIAAILAALPLAVSGAAFAMPNPIAEYETYEEAKTKIGFAPLHIPKIAGYDLYFVSIISGDVADLSYRRSGEANTEVRVRTAAASAESRDNISGVYSDEWTERKIKNLDVSVCKLNGKNYVASWSTGGYLFSVQTEGLSQYEFYTLLEDALIDLSVHYYPLDKNTVTTEL